MSKELGYSFNNKLVTKGHFAKLMRSHLVNDSKKKKIRRLK